MADELPIEPESFDREKDRSAFKFGWDWGVRYAQRAVRGFMCKIDFEDELGAACGGNKIFPSVEDLKANKRCAESCGIVEVEVRFVRIVQPERFSEE